MDTNRLSGFEKDQLRKKFGKNQLSGAEMDVGRKAKTKKESMAKKMSTNGMNASRDNNPSKGANN